MNLRTIALVAASGLMLSAPLTAEAATTHSTAKSASTACKGLKGKELKTCKANMKKAAKTK